MINDSIEKSFTLLFDSWRKDREIHDTQFKNQVDIGSEKNVNSPIILIVAHQTAARIRLPNKTDKKEVSDILNVPKSFGDIDGVR